MTRSIKTIQRARKHSNSTAQALKILNRLLLQPLPKPVLLSKLLSNTPSSAIFWGRKNIAGESSLKFLIAQRLLSIVDNWVNIEDEQEVVNATIDEEIEAIEKNDVLIEK